MTSERYSISREELNALAELPLEDDRHKLVNKIYRTQGPLVPVDKMRNAFHNAFGNPMSKQTKHERHAQIIERLDSIRRRLLAGWKSGSSAIRA